MSNCGKCGGSTGCTCTFASNPSATVTGNGRSYAAINYHPNNVPSPRPFGQLFRKDSDQVVPINSSTPIVFDEHFSVFNGTGGSMVNFPAFPSRLTVPIGGAGYYQVAAFACITFDINAYLVIRKNGSTFLEGQIGVPAGGFNGELTTMSLIDMVVGDYLEAVLVTAGTGPVTINRFGAPFAAVSTDCYPHFWAQWVRST